MSDFSANVALVLFTLRAETVVIADESDANKRRGPSQKWNISKWNFLTEYFEYDVVKEHFVTPKSGDKNNALGGITFSKSSPAWYTF
jgi:hypothetical protein